MLSDNRIIDQCKKEIYSTYIETKYKRPTINNPKLCKALSYFMISENKTVHQIVEELLISAISAKDENTWQKYFDEKENLNFEMVPTMHFFEDTDRKMKLKKDREKQKDSKFLQSTDLK